MLEVSIRGIDVQLLQVSDQRPIIEPNALLQVLGREDLDQSVGFSQQRRVISVQGRSPVDPVPDLV
jgi:hypothetical protein